jgi:hypothetical protein
MSGRVASLTHRLRVMFYIALSNFVFPGAYFERWIGQAAELMSRYCLFIVIFKAMIAPLIYVDSLNFMFIMYLEPINMYVNIFGIVFATGASLALLRTICLMNSLGCSVELRPSSYYKPGRSVHRERSQYLIEDV